MELFYIDRQFGSAIFIDVENGIVQRCHGGEKTSYTDKMDEKYKGNTINFLKEDYIGRAMKGTYHHLRPMAICSALNKIDAVKSRINNLNNLISGLPAIDATRRELRGRIKELELQQYEFEKELTKEKERILNEHNFVM
jgi:hypothetical protein